MNLLVQNFLKRYHVKLFTTSSERKASIVERFNCTIKGIMFRLFTKNNKRRYIHMLNDIVNKCNNLYHRGIKMKQIGVNKDNELLVWINLYENKLKNSQTGPRRNTFFIGDLVQVCIEWGPLKKGYLEGWGEVLLPHSLQITRSSCRRYKRNILCNFRRTSEGYWTWKLQYWKGSSEKKKKIVLEISFIL